MRKASGSGVRAGGLTSRDGHVPFSGRTSAAERTLGTRQQQQQQTGRLMKSVGGLSIGARAWRVAFVGWFVSAAAGTGTRPSVVSR